MGPMSDPAPLTVVPVNENIPITDKTPAPEPTQVAAVLERRRGGRWFPAFCALLALIAAAVALAASGLRPRVAAVADQWLGAGNAVSAFLAPSPAIEAGWQQAREAAMHALDARLADYTARLDRLTAAQQATAADVARALADVRANHGLSESLSRAVDDLSRQTRELRATATAIDARARAAGLLALALRLRRDIDAGLPINRDVAALAAAGPYPAPIDHALQQLHAISDGTPTMRDLADQFDQVIAQLAARNGAETSWARAGWNRVATLFGRGAPPSEDARLVRHLRTLAVDGRFSEAAGELEASDAADIGANWAAQVHARAEAVVATQALLAYSLAAYQNAFAATGTK
jgi:hypothetical protein